MAIPRQEGLLSSPGRRVGALLSLVLVVDLLLVLALGLMPLDSIARLRCEAVLRGGNPESGLRLTASIEARKDVLCDDAASGRRVTMIVAGLLVLLIGAGAVLAPADRLERALVRRDEEDDDDRWEREAAQREAEAREARDREERALADARRAAQARAQEDQLQAAGDRRAARVEKARAARLAARSGAAAKPGRKSAATAKKVVKPAKATSRPAKGTKKAVTAGSAAVRGTTKVATAAGSTALVAKGTRKVATAATAAGKGPRKDASAVTPRRPRGIKKVETQVIDEVAPVTPAPAETEVAALSGLAQPSEAQVTDEAPTLGSAPAPPEAPVTEEVTVVGPSEAEVAPEASTLGSAPAPSEAPVTEEVTVVGPAEAEGAALDTTSPEAPEPTRVDRKAAKKAAKEAAKTEAVAQASKAGSVQKVGTSRRGGRVRRAVGLGEAGGPPAGAEVGPAQGIEGSEGGDAAAPPEMLPAQVEATGDPVPEPEPEATSTPPVEQDAVAPEAAAPPTGTVRRVGTSRRAGRGAPRP